MCSTNPVSAKTAASVLQELMTKKGRMPEYECIGQSGLDHEKVFEYLCTADGVTVIAAARSKKDAKQAAARQALAALAARGETIPAPFNIPLEANEKKNGEEAAAVEGAAGAVVAAAADSTSYVAVLKEFCEQHCEAAPEYSLVEETGPPHLRRFTMTAVVGDHKFMATASSKRAARQDAAAQLYRYLRENLPTTSNVLKKEDELVSANERAMQRYSAYTYWGESWGLPSVRSRGPPSLRNQTLAQYYDTGLRNSVTQEQRVAALTALDAGGEDAVMLALRALKLQVRFERLGPLVILRVPHAVPPLTFAALAPDTPERILAEYLQNALTLKTD